MSEAPKKIWVTNAMQHMIPRSDPNDPPFPSGMKPIRSTIYIRADVVEEVLEALVKLRDYANDSIDCQYGTLSASLVQDITNDAIKALEEE